MKKMTVILILAMFAAYPAIAAGTAPAIQFDYEDGATADELGAAFGVPVYAEMDSAKYGASAGKYLIQEASIRLRSGDEYRMLLSCSGLDRSGACRGIQITVVDERKTPAAVIQRLKLGDGYAPQVIFPDLDDRSAAMFRAIRAGDNTEAHVYNINPVTGRLDEKLAITRAFPEKMKLQVTGEMKPGGIVQAESKKPDVKRSVDMSSELDSLIEDELYQPDGDPIKALVNLRLVRGGWEEESIYKSGGEIFIEVGMSLVSLSKKPVLDATVVLKLGESGEWGVSDIRFEPSLPYRSE